MIKKILLGTAVIVVFGAYAWFLRGTKSKATVATTASTPTPTTTPAASATVTSTSTPTPSGTYKDGTYTSPVEDAFYGNLQFELVVSGGKITDVQFLQYPNDRHDSVEISNYAMPILKRETIKAQSTNVDIVSGATQTSDAFQQGLADVLAQARS